MCVGVGGLFCAVGVGVVSSEELRSGGSDCDLEVLKGMFAVLCLVILGATPASEPK